MLMRLRPRRIASYSAASARAYHSALLPPACQPATPIESVIRSLTPGKPRTTSGTPGAGTGGSRSRPYSAGWPVAAGARTRPRQTGDQAVAPDIGEEDLADDTQDLVADVVPLGVVDTLK